MLNSKLITILLLVLFSFGLSSVTFAAEETKAEGTTEVAAAEGEEGADGEKKENGEGEEEEPDCE